MQDHIKFLKNEGCWPDIFDEDKSPAEPAVCKKTEKENDSSDDDDDDQDDDLFINTNRRVPLFARHRNPDATESSSDSSSETSDSD